MGFTIPGTFTFELWQARFSLLRGISATLLASGLTIVAATVMGVLLGTILAYGWWPLRLLARLYVDILRGIPVLVLILFTYYGLALFGINVPAFWAGVIALSAFATAHVAENLRGAVQSVPAGQMEAAKAIGLRFPQRLRYVVLPQAIRRMLPPWVNTGLEIVKGTTLLSVIGVVELLLSTQQIVARNYMIIDFYLVAGLLYLIINFSIAQLGAALERRFSYLRY
ncbi:amino acid ABC transporter membrane protein 2 (PAAT family) [Humitalea rosea]|uniref:Amino acid ABC transporter membrane protein 2 (PAAT family) n=1 Tax=Humitalea rosea TaxID=990373 RepID=A0A2W7INT7_9PROT|nr:amino acid ABC transporter permease [Humitalea rosea]PZW48749.1 amino acid ABC transporter membrane protein 2 (PAAT family) [Humitalea rosea]